MADSNITKHALAQALKALTETLPFDKISVGNICAQCGLNRKSFYYHFKDKYDLVNWIYYTEFIEVALKKNTDPSGTFSTKYAAIFMKTGSFIIKPFTLKDKILFRSISFLLLKVFFPKKSKSVSQRSPL